MHGHRKSTSCLTLTVQLIFDFHQIKPCTTERAPVGVFDPRLQTLIVHHVRTWLYAGDRLSQRAIVVGIVACCRRSGEGGVILVGGRGIDDLGGRRILGGFEKLHAHDAQVACHLV